MPEVKTKPTRSTKTKAEVPSAPPATHQGATVALRAGADEGRMAYIPLSQLVLDPLNVRKKGGEEVAELAALIESQGLLQNLVVVDRAGLKGGSVFGVVAGGRRLRALLLLEKAKKIPADFEVLCSVVSLERARAISAAENSGREPMSVADTVLAFADMVREGAGVEDLAVAFGLPLAEVRRRLRLAAASPRLFEAFRAGELELDCLMALCLTEDTAKQEEVWDSLPSYDREASRIKRLIAGDVVEARLVQFVGLAAYEAAGGEVLRDLFAQDDENAARLTNPLLLTRLATERLGQEAKALVAQGVVNVVTLLRFGYSEQQAYPKAPVSERAPTPDELAEAERLSAALQEVEEKLFALQDDDDADEKEVEKLEAEVVRLQDVLAALEEARGVADPEVAHLVVAVVSIGQSGALQVNHNRIRKEDLQATFKRAKGRSADAGEGTEAPGAGDDADGVGISQALCASLTAHRTMAIQAILAQDPQKGLAALAHALALGVLYDVMSTYQLRSALGVRGGSTVSRLHDLADDLQDSAAAQALQAHLDRWRARVPAQPAELLGWLLQQPISALVDLLSVCAAVTVDAVQSVPALHPADELVGRIGLDMADWWAPTQAGFFARVSKATISEALTEAGKTEAAGQLGKLKKGEAAALAEQQMQGSRWIPKLMR